MIPQDDILTLRSHLREIPTGQRGLRMIAAEILTHMHDALMKRPGHTPSWVRFAMPYVKAMRQLDTIDSDYGAESGRGVVLYALSNLTQWRGEDARRIKAELNSILKGN